MRMSANELVRRYNAGERDFQGADLTRRLLFGRLPTRAQREQATLSEANLRGADLIGADLNGANLRGAEGYKDYSNGSRDHPKGSRNPGPRRA